MGFRSYIREFLVAILMLFRPSGPCCLGVAEALFLSLESSVAKIILLVFSHSGAIVYIYIYYIRKCLYMNIYVYIYIYINSKDIRPGKYT